jgi:ubiquinone/menaquinone biosynthesis C-methylase UbiE
MREPSLKAYEEIIDIVDNELKNFKEIKNKIEVFAGGFKDKCVLEIGTGFHFPQAGILCALAILEGATNRVFGIDIYHPCDECSSKRKGLFWKMFSKKVGELRTIGYVNKGCIKFITKNVIWDDKEYNKLTFLQMSASDMYFKDEMFDLIMSKATFEHLKRPKEALREIKRVLKVGGYIYLSWNPFTSLRMGGHDIGIPYYYPWAHLRLSKEEHIQKLREVYSNKKIYETMPIEHRPNDELAYQYAKDPEGLRNGTLQDLNQIRVKEFLEAVNSLNLKIVYIENIIIDEERKYLTEEIRQELSQYLAEELLMTCQQIVLQKL